VLCAQPNAQVETRTSSLCHKLYDAFGRARSLLREVGVAASVPIEPELQTSLLDATMQVWNVQNSSSFLMLILYQFGFWFSSIL
jgi:hypothetical protein